MVGLWGCEWLWKLNSWHTLIQYSQRVCFATEVTLLKAKKPLPRGNSLIHVPLHPFIDSDETLRVRGRENHSSLLYAQTHSVIHHEEQHLTKLIVRSEQLRLLHAGPTIVFSSLSRRFHFLGMKQIIRFVIRQCTICHQVSTWPSPQMMGQLLVEQVMPGTVFEKVGVDYAGTLQVKYGMVHKPTTV